MSSTRKVVVIGAGPGRLRLRHPPRSARGQSVTVVEKDELGGTCLNVGCIPSKALIAAGALLERITRADQMGITRKDVTLDVGELVTWKADVVAKLTGGVAGLLKNHKVEKSVKGKARFLDKNTVEVSGASGQADLCEPTTS